jgi:hypothetical protein
MYHETYGSREEAVHDRSYMNELCQRSYSMRQLGVYTNLESNSLPVAKSVPL